MSKIIAVVPNICEGRDNDFIDDLTAQLRQVTNLMMLDVAVDHVLQPDAGELRAHWRTHAPASGLALL